MNADKDRILIRILRGLLFASLSQNRHLGYTPRISPAPRGKFS